MQLAGPPTEDSTQYFKSLRNNGNNNHVFIQTSSELGSLSYLGRKREWVCIFDSASEVSLACFWVWYERITCVPNLQQRADFSKWESVILHCWFSAKRRFLKVREGYFALLILSKWEFREEYVQTIKCLLQRFPSSLGSVVTPWMFVKHHALLFRYITTFSLDTPPCCTTPLQV